MIRPKWIVRLKVKRIAARKIGVFLHRNREVDFIPGSRGNPDAFRNRLGAVHGFHARAAASPSSESQVSATSVRNREPHPGLHVIVGVAEVVRLGCLHDRHRRAARMLNDRDDCDCANDDRCDPTHMDSGKLNRAQ